MKSFPKNISVLGLGISAFDRLGLESYLPNYKILTMGDSSWVNNFSNLKDKIFKYNNILPEASLHYLETSIALKELDWQKIKESLKIDYLLTYKPCEVQTEFQEKNKLKILNNSFDLYNKFENKVSFREVANGAYFPKYEILSFSDLKGKTYKYFSDIFEKFVVQDSKLSGGRGTFIISNQQEYKQALDHLAKVGSLKVVVSKFILGKSASVQVCITKYGTFTLPLQNQVIDQSILVNNDLPGFDSFNGGQWSSDDFSDEENIIAKKHVISIANKMQKIGYKGIFGVDLVISDSGVYIIEVNARLTGMTPTITQIQNYLKQTPFLLLHVMEHLGADYELSEDEVKDMSNLTFGNFDYGYLILFNNKNEKFKINRSLLPGIYSFKNNKLTFEKLAYKVDAIENSDQFLLVDFRSKDESIHINQRMGRIIFKKKVMDDNGNIFEDIAVVVTQIRKVL